MFFAPTALQYDHGDTMVIQSYDDETGILTLTEGMPNYHFGKPQAEVELTYDGLDVRGEVLLLDRNIKLVGTDTDNWGCQFVTTDVLITSGDSIEN